MDELPELPFEQVLSYLNLKDRLKARTVSRAWRNKFDRYPVNTLCYSNRPIDRIFEKSRLVNGAFAENFINSPRFASFFDAFGKTILSSLKRLRLCDLHLTEGDPAAFTRTLNSFVKLEQLDIIRARLNHQDVLRLNLPMLISLQLEYVNGIKKLTLEAPRLRDVKIQLCYLLRVEIVHGESVERLLIDDWVNTEVKKLKNLQYLYAYQLPWADSTFLSSIKQLKEIHTNDPENVSKLFEQKQRYRRVDLKIYFNGLLLSGPDDPARNSLNSSLFGFLDGESFACLAENRSRLADQIPFYKEVSYSAIEGIAPDVEVDLLKRCTNLNKFITNIPVQDTQRLLDLLKNFNNIVDLTFRGDQLQDLFDRLPEHCAVQWLFIYSPPCDQAFLFRLKHLIHLCVGCSIDIETVRRAFQELPALSSFRFRYGNQRASIEIGLSKQFTVSVDDKQKSVSDVNAAIKFITRKEKSSRSKKRKAETLE